METQLQELLDKEINLSQTHISQGSTSHVYIRDLLTNKRYSDSDFPWLMDGEDFLSGSYARGTKLHPLNDIDVMIVLDGTGLVPVGLGETHYVHGNTASENSPVHQHIGYDNLLNSHSVLETFQQALALSHPNSTIKKNGQAVNVQLSSYNLGIDIVPCFHIKPLNSSQQDFYYIPRGDASGRWLKTNPKIDAHISKNLHDRHNKKLKGVIKLLKYWNREKNAARIKSYHLETLAWHVFHNHTSGVTSISEGVRYFFNNTRSYLENPMYEATGFGELIDTYLTPVDRQLSLDVLDKAKAVTQTSGLLVPVANWRVIFGDKFGN